MPLIPVAEAKNFTTIYKMQILYTEQMYAKKPMVVGDKNYKLMKRKT